MKMRSEGRQNARFGRIFFLVGLENINGCKKGIRQ